MAIRVGNGEMGKPSDTGEVTAPSLSRTQAGLMGGTAAPLLRSWLGIVCTRREKPARARTRLPGNSHYIIKHPKRAAFIIKSYGNYGE